MVHPTPEHSAAEASHLRTPGTLKCIMVTVYQSMKRLSAVVSDEEYARVERLARAGAANSVADLVRQAVRRYAEELGSSKLVVFRDISLPQARTEITAYLKKKAGVVWPDEMAEELGIDYRTVLQVVNELTREGKLEVIETKAEALTQ